jgi:acetyl esterase/lipase
MHSKDIMPPWGLSFQKPSVLWPPPTDDMSRRVHASLRTRLRQALRIEDPQNVTATMLSEYRSSSSAGEGVDGGPSVSLPVLDPPSQQAITLTTRSGEVLSTSNQLHMYTQNSLLPHPLISPVLSYLGGLPPLLVIAGDGEVLRDEIVYMWVAERWQSFVNLTPLTGPIKPRILRIIPLQKRHEHCTPL